MRSIFLAAALYAAGFADAFQQSAPCTVRVAAAAQSASGSATALHEYVPSGFTKASWAKFKAEEAKKKEAARNLGGLGPRGFKSRSMQSFQEALERGEAEHLMPMFNAKEKLAKGQIRKEDIPYMQRGGSWDNSDVSGAKKKKWLNSDKEYAGGGYKRFQSVSILYVSSAVFTFRLTFRPALGNTC